MSEKCRFCNIIKNRSEVYGDVDKPFLFDQKYFSLVSIGGFVKGWTLLIPKEHKYNLCVDYANIEFYIFLQKHIMYIREKMDWHDRIIVFEHGANKCDSETACGTSHAHLHILPFSESILEDILSENQWIKCRWEMVEEIVEENEYLLYSEEPEKGMGALVYIHIVTIPESQYFRKVIFNKLKLEGSYSYKEDERFAESMQTHKLLEE